MTKVNFDKQNKKSSGLFIITPSCGASSVARRSVGLLELVLVPAAYEFAVRFDCLVDRTFREVKEMDVVDDFAA